MAMMLGSFQFKYCFYLRKCKSFFENINPVKRLPADTLDIESLARVSQETNTKIHNIAYNENSRTAKDILPTSNSSLTFRPWGSEYKGSERDDEISSNTSCKKENPRNSFDGGLY